MKTVGISSYGFYLPRYRIKVSEIASVWKKNNKEIENSLGITEKTVASTTEDSVTMAYEACSMALKCTPHIKINALFFGSESPPYAVNPSSTILGEFLHVGNNYLAYDTQFACKAGTGAFISAHAMVLANQAETALVCAADKATGRPHDLLEYTAASGAVALVVGKKEPIVIVNGWTSFSSDTPDFWRREGMKYPSHGGRFTGKPSYFTHIIGSVTQLLRQQKKKIESFDYVVFHMPNGRFPLQVAQKLGCSRKQIEQSFVVPTLGNSYTASGLMGLVSVFDVAQPGETVLFASYGSGAGSDAIMFTVTKHILRKRQSFKKYLHKKEYIDYPTYLQYMQII